MLRDRARAADSDHVRYETPLFRALKTTNYIILYGTVLCCIVLYCAVLYYTIPGPAGPGAGVV
eukprot:6007629-Heterocapsa_arctica.AAC.1